MPRRSTLLATALGAALAAACRDTVAPDPAGMIPPPSLSEALKTWQCFTRSSASVTQVAPGTEGAVTIAALAGQVVTRVALKGGSACWFTPDGATGTYTVLVDGAPCYTVEGLGTAMAVVTRVGSAPGCKNVTHVEYASGPAQPATGSLQVCKGIENASLGFLVEPFTYLVAGVIVTIPLGEPGTTFPPLSCAEPIALAAGDYIVAEQPNFSALPLIDVASVPSDRLLGEDLLARTATVRVVAAETTVVTFTSVWLADPPT